MSRLLMLVASSIGSALGWYIGEQIGGTWTAFTLSSVGLIAGIWWGRKKAREWG